MRLVSKSEFARLRGVTPPMVTKWRKAGRLVMEGNKVNVVASAAMLVAVQDPARGGKNGKTRRRAGAESGTAPDALRPGSFDDVRTQRESFVAKGAELDYLERIGTLVERARYDKALEDGLRIIMLTLDGLAPRLGPVLVGLTDQRVIENRIDAEVEQISKDAAATIRALIDDKTPTRQ